MINTKAATECPFLTELNRLASKPKFASLPDGYFVGMSVQIPIVEVTLASSIQAGSTNGGNSVTGTARCAPTDAFSIMIGFSVAATRAMEKQLAQTYTYPYTHNYPAMKSEVERILGRSVQTLSFAFSESRRVLANELEQKGASAELLASLR